MRFKWDETKGKRLKRERGLGFEEIGAIFENPYHLSQKSDEPEQWRAIGWVKDKLVSLIYEERQDKEGIYYWFVTYWHATQAETELYNEG